MTSSDITEQQLLDQLRDPLLRDQGFRQLMRQYGQVLYWHIRRMVIDHDDAQDVMQETAIKILENIGKFKGNSQLSTWVYRIATNEALMHLRKKTSLFQSINSLAPELAERLEAQSDLSCDHATVLFQQALLQLPTQQRIAFNLRYYDEMPYEQIAQVTGKSVATLKSNYHYAVKKIENYIKEHSV